MFPVWPAICRPNQQPPLYPFSTAHERREAQRSQQTSGPTFQLTRPPPETRPSHGSRPVHRVKYPPPIGGRLDHVPRYAPTSGPESTLLVHVNKMAESSSSENDGGSDVVCPVCEQVFKTEKAERRYFTLEHNKEVLVHICEECRKTYASPSSLKRHQAVRHPGLKTKRPLNVKVKYASKTPAKTSSPPVEKAKKLKITDPTKVKFKTVTRSMTSVPTSTVSKPPTPDFEEPAYENISPPRPSTSKGDPSDADPNPGVVDFTDRPPVIPMTPTASSSYVVPSPVQPLTIPTPNLPNYLGNLSSTSSEFNLSQYLIVPPELRQSTPKITPYPSPATLRPWTPTEEPPPTNQTSDTLTTPDPPANGSHPTSDNLPTTVTFRLPAPSKWDSPPVGHVDLPPPLVDNPPTSNHEQSENPIPTNSFSSTPIVQYGSAESSDAESPANNSTLVHEPFPTTIPTTNTGFSRGMYTMTNTWYRNYRPISNSENTELQGKIDRITALINEIIPGRGRLMGEFILFQYLINRPEGDED